MGGVCTRKNQFDEEGKIISPIKTKLKKKHAKVSVTHSDRLDEHYKLGRIIGTGSFGVVRKAKSLHPPYEKVAIKIIDKKKVSDPALLQGELEILSKTDHPNLIKFYRFFEDSKYLHIVMEFCSGGELFEKMVEQTSLNEHTASLYMEKIFLAVTHLHSLNFCHRDIKPQNFLFENKLPEAELKLIDFGLANRFSGDKKMNTFVGTPYYVAPEVIRGSYGKSCDLWSCGVIMYVMLSGKLPFSGKSETEIFANIMQGKLDTRQKKWAKISPRAKDLIHKLLTPNPKTRMSAKDALRHPWVKRKNSIGVSIDPSVLNRIARFKSSSQMKGLALGIMVKHLEVQQIKDLRQAFYELDKSSSGYLDVEEVRKGLAAHLPEEEGDLVFRNLDVRGDGKINYSEFLAAALSHKLDHNEQLMWHAFQVFDVDGSGYITKENLEMVFKRMGIDRSSEEIESIIKEVDLAQDGRISFEEFKSLITDL